MTVTPAQAAAAAEAEQAGARRALPGSTVSRREHAQLIRGKITEVQQQRRGDWEKHKAINGTQAQAHSQRPHQQCQQRQQQQQYQQQQQQQYQQQQQRQQQQQSGVSVASVNQYHQNLQAQSQYNSQAYAVPPSYVHASSVGSNQQQQPPAFYDGAGSMSVMSVSGSVYSNNHNNNDGFASASEMQA